MIDRIIKLLVLCLGCLLIFLVGHLLLGDLDATGRPGGAPAAATQAAPGNQESEAGYLATKRVKTVPVRPGEPVVAPQKP